MSRTDHDPYAPPSAPPIVPIRVDLEALSPTAEHIEGPFWLTIWNRPRSTIRTIVDTQPTHGVIPLAAFWGFGTALAQLLQGKAAEELSVSGAFGVAAVIGPIAGIIYFYVGAGLMRMTGGWLGGRAAIDEARAAWSWSAIPNLVTLAMVVGSLLAFGPTFFSPDPKAPPDPNLAFIVGSALTFNAWSFFISLKCLGEVQRFSALAAFASALLALLLVVAILVAVVLLTLALGGFPAVG